jgi:hypothetical protein
MPKEELLDRWRKITFRYSGEAVSFRSAVNHRQEGNDHQVISSNFPVVLNQLKNLAAENIQDTPMGIEEIVVQILKGGKNVEII